MGKYVPWDEQKKRRKEWSNKHEENRKNYRKITDSLGKRLISQTRMIVKNCGLDQIQVSDFSGLGASLVSRFMNRRISPKVQFGTIVSLLFAAGYRIKLERMDSKEDKFYDERRLPPGSGY